MSFALGSYTYQRGAAGQWQVFAGGAWVDLNPATTDFAALAAAEGAAAMPADKPTGGPLTLNQIRALMAAGQMYPAHGDIHGDLWQPAGSAGQEYYRIEGRGPGDSPEGSYGQDAFGNAGSVRWPITGATWHASYSADYGDFSWSPGFMGEVVVPMVFGGLAVATGMAAVGAFGGGASTALVDSSAAEITVGNFAEEAYAANAAAQTGVTAMAGEPGNLSDWLSSYSSDPGPDPFATTNDVNAGWSQQTGYGEGIPYGGNSGTVAPAASLSDIIGKGATALRTGLDAIRTLTAPGPVSPGNRVQSAPGRDVASANLTPLLLAAVGWLVFKG